MVASVTKHSFSSTPLNKVPRSKFNRSHGCKTTFDAGDLVPVFIDEALPGDTFSLKMSYFARISTLLRPIMDNVFLDSFFFAVPMRLVWDNWQKFNGEQANPSDSVDFVIPQCVTPVADTTPGVVNPSIDGFPPNSLSDYLGIPPRVPGLSHSSLFYRAYYFIWNEWFRDENLQDSIPVPLGDGPDSPSDFGFSPILSDPIETPSYKISYFPLMKRGKRRDYFTSSLPWPQKTESVNIPLGLSAPVVSNSLSPDLLPQSGDPSSDFGKLVSDTSGVLSTANAPSASSDMIFGSETGLEVDFSNSKAVLATINDLRQAFQVQRMYEKDARGGTRYTEIIHSHFGVVSPDSRLQRPEFLGGASTPLIVHPVSSSENAVQITGDSTTEEVPLGTLGAYGTFASSRHGFHRFFTEHCIVLGFVSVRADLNYQQGLNKMFSRRTRFDFYWPSLSHLGEQAILNKEIYAQGSLNVREDDAVFGYQERFAEYRYKPSIITGLFRSVADDSKDGLSYDIWHLTQFFGNLPTLSDQFIQENPPISRVTASAPTIADSDTNFPKRFFEKDSFLFDAYFDFVCTRPMPAYGKPGYVDHF